MRSVIGLSGDTNAFGGVVIGRDLHTCNWVLIGAPSRPVMGRNNPGALHQMKIEKTVNGCATAAKGPRRAQLREPADHIVWASSWADGLYGVTLFAGNSRPGNIYIYIQQADPWLPGSWVGKEIQDEMGFLEGKRIWNSGNSFASEIEMFSLPKTVIKLFFLTCIERFPLDYQIIFSPQNNHKSWANYVTGCRVKILSRDQDQPQTSKNEMHRVRKT